MNWIDMILLAVLTAALWWGMLSGIKRQLIGLSSLCLAGGFALWLYPELAALLRSILHGISRQGQETVAFLLMFIAVFNLINYGVRSSATPCQARWREGYPAGAALEAVLAQELHRFVLAPLTMLGSLSLASVSVSACIWLGVATGVLRLSLALPWPAYDGIRCFLYHELLGSTLVRLFDCAFCVAYAYANSLMSDANSLLTRSIYHLSQLQL
jgi:hypothetical protein